MARHAALETFGRSGNPVFGDKFNQSQGFVGSETMTLDGTVNKTGILLGLCFIGAVISWNIPNPFFCLNLRFDLFSKFGGNDIIFLSINHKSRNFLKMRKIPFTL